MRPAITRISLLLAGAMLAAPCDAAPHSVVCPPGGQPVESLAAKEVRRYLYLRTGTLPPLADRLPTGNGSGEAILVGSKNQPAIRAWCEETGLLPAIDPLGPDQYLLRTVESGGRRVLAVIGGDAMGTLYGAYRLAEHLGVRFYLHGDVIPDEPIAMELPVLDETRKPLFDRRGILPFHDFPEGPDWWTRDGYKMVLDQLPKMGMNFIGMHTYPEHPVWWHVGPEPLVWIGPPDELNADGSVKASYPARHFTTGNPNGAWGMGTASTSTYYYGAADLFEDELYGAEYMQGTHPWNQMSMEQSNAMFERTGAFFNDVFTYAAGAGVKTCIGTETPMHIPTPVKERLKAAGKNPADPAVIQSLYEGMFQRVAKIHPLDYFWLWTPENWIMTDVKKEQIEETVTDFRALLAAAETVKPPFTLATCGWRLGPPQDPAMFDEFLPKEMPMSTISLNGGITPVETGFAKIQGRPKWAIPWFEDDPGIAMPQLWVGRLRRDAADALEYGCTGLMGIHWRTRVLAPNMSALAQAAWDQSGWNKSSPGAAGADVRIPEGAEGGIVGQFPQNQVSDADVPVIYQSVRYDLKAYHIDVPNGTYNVTLKFVEPAHGAAGKRVFDVKVQDQVLAEDLDVFARVGSNKALDLTARDVVIKDGRLTIRFTPKTEFPCVAGIVIEGMTEVMNQFASASYSRKINCGAQAHGDYQGDLDTIGADGKVRNLPSADFYADWARAEFGAEAAEPVAAIFTHLDGKVPRPGTWVAGPGSIKPDPRPWEVARADYRFVDELESLRPKIKGAGNLDRYDYWLNTFRYLRLMGEVRCAWAAFDAALATAKAGADPQERQRLACELALPARKHLVKLFADFQKQLLAFVSNSGEMGSVCNWQQQTLPTVLTAPGKELAALLGSELPADAMPSKEYTGDPRIIVPDVRTVISAGEALRLKVILLGKEPEAACVQWRPLGSGDFRKIPLTHVARGVFSAAFPAEAVKADFEYRVEATVSGKPLVYPATAPRMNQTVVVKP